MSFKEKIITVLTVFIFLLLLAGFGAFKPSVDGTGQPEGEKAAEVNENTDAAEIRHLGGIAGRMPENSALVFFRSTMGRSLSSYTAYDSIDEMLCALRGGKVDAVWACDVTADYLCASNSDLRLLPYDDMSDIEKDCGHERFSFGMALKDDASHNQLCKDINSALADMKQDGTLEWLLDTYVYGAEGLIGEENTTPLYTVDDMKSAKQRGSAIYVGISGAVPPLELLDKDSEPYGFCVALMDNIGTRLGRTVEFMVLDNETIFTSLVSGRIDLVFTYGTGNITVEGKKKYIMTEPYCEMQRYMFITTDKKS